MSDNQLLRAMLRQSEVHTLYNSVSTDGHYGVEIPVPQLFITQSSAATVGQRQVLNSAVSEGCLPPNHVSVTEIGHYVSPHTEPASTAELTRVPEFFPQSSSASHVVSSENVVTISVQHVSQPDACPAFDNTESVGPSAGFGSVSLAKQSPQRSSSGPAICRDRKQIEGGEKEKPVYTCELCQTTFRRASNLKIHIQRHMGIKPFSCDQCSAAFVEEKNLKRHLVAHRTDRPHVCQECGLAFVESGNLTRHMLTHSGSKDFVCDSCGAAFSKIHHLKDHLASHAGGSKLANRKHVCEECHNVFNNPFQLRKHIKSAHSEGSGRPYVCSQCGSVFGWWSIFRRHLLTHRGQKPFVCDKCDQAFTDNLALRRHKRTHVRDKTNQCPICDAAFDRPSHLVRHVRVHTGEKPNVCSECGAAFLERNKLVRHMRIHKDTVGSVVCEQCGARFNQIRHFTHHMRSHAEGGGDHSQFKEMSLVDMNNPASSAKRHKPSVKSSVAVKRNKSRRKVSIKRVAALFVKEENVLCEEPEKARMASSFDSNGQYRKTSFSNMNIDERCTDTNDKERVKRRKRLALPKNDLGGNMDNLPRSRWKKMNNAETVNGLCQATSAAVTEQKRATKGMSTRQSKRLQGQKFINKSKSNPRNEIEFHSLGMSEIGECNFEDDEGFTSADTTDDTDLRNRFEQVKEEHDKSIDKAYLVSSLVLPSNDKVVNSQLLSKITDTILKTEHGVTVPVSNCQRKPEGECVVSTETSCSKIVATSEVANKEKEEEEKEDIESDYPLVSEDDGLKLEKDVGNPGDELHQGDNDKTRCQSRGPSSSTDDVVVNEIHSIPEQESRIDASTVSLGDQTDTNVAADDDGREGSHCLQTAESVTLHHNSSAAVSQTSMPNDKALQLRELLQCSVTEERDHHHHHHRRHDEEEKEKAGFVLFACQLCSAVFNSAFSLKLHKRVHETRVAVCLRCGDLFASSTELALHREACVGFLPLQLVPETASPHPTSERPGQSSENGEGTRPHGCHLCGASFAHLNKLKLHMQFHTDSRKFVCNECGASFNKSADLRAHIRTHTGDRPFVCDICGASYTQSSTLSVHMKTHSGQKPHVCEMCGAAFPRKGRLKVHMRCHSGDKPCVCKLCGAAFKWSQTLLRHTKRQHSQPPYTCQLCRGTFHQEKLYLAHLQVHKGERPHSCPHCDKAFKLRIQLERHSRVHTGNWPFLCEECGAGFGSAASLKIHTRCHTGEKPYVCEECGRAFRISSHLTRHMNSHTDVPVFVKRKSHCLKT